MKFLESAKLRALRALVPYVPRALRARVPNVTRALHALVPYVLSCPTYVLHALRALVTHVPRALRVSCPTCSCTPRASRPTCSRALCASCALRAFMPLVPYVLWRRTCSRASYHTCTHALRTSCPICCRASRHFVPCMLSCLVPYLFSCLTCFTCSGTSRVLHVLVPHVSFALHFLGMLVTQTLRNLCS